MHSSMAVRITLFANETEEIVEQFTNTNSFQLFCILNFNYNHIAFKV